GKASCVGNVNGSRSLGMAAAIPLISYLAVGMIVKLTVNFVPEVCLAKQSRGVIRDIIYSNGYDRDEIPVGVIEMIDYKGEPFITSQDSDDAPDHALNKKSKYEILGATELRCDCKRCCGIGIPICVAKSDSVHSLQGMTIGQTKAIKRMVMKWSTKAESLWPNILYVGGSRVQKENEILLAHPIAESDLKKVATTPTWKLQDATLKNIVTKADKQLDERRIHHNKMNPDLPEWGSKEHFVLTLARFVQRARERLQPNGAIAHIEDKAKLEIEACLDEWATRLE
ncbi:hypothetical protein SARC_07683, partial [Sphaeroforma arctica JP610]